MPWSANSTTATITGAANLNELDSNTPSWVSRHQAGPVTVYVIARRLSISSGASLWIDPTSQCVSLRMEIVLM